MATLPVLPLSDAVLLPGMVIPVTLDPATQAAVDAARSTGDNTVVAVPRLDGEYGPVGTTAVIDKVGRLPSGEPAAVIRGLTRARIGSGVPGPDFIPGGLASAVERVLGLRRIGRTCKRTGRGGCDGWRWIGSGLAAAGRGDDSGGTRRPRHHGHGEQSARCVRCYSGRDVG